MLDGESTAERLRAALVEGYGQWHEADPQRNTKAELAREIARRSGRTCTPQTVSGWFKTGRMDKVWIGYVEQILGTTLGFGSAGSALEAAVMKTLLAAGVAPTFLEPGGRIAVPEWLKGVIPGRTFRPDFCIELGNDRRMFVEVKSRWPNPHTTAALEDIQARHPEEFRLLGLKGDAVHEARELAAELLTRARAGEIELAAATANAAPDVRGTSFAPSQALLQAAQLLGSGLLKADRMTRDAMAPLLAQLARSPEDAPRIGRMMEALLNASPSEPPAEVVDPTGHRPHLGDEPGDSQLGGLDEVTRPKKPAGGAQ